MRSSRDHFPVHYPMQASGIEVQQRIRGRTSGRAAHTNAMTNNRNASITNWTELWSATARS